MKTLDHYFREAHIDHDFRERLSMQAQEEMTRLTIAVPASLRALLKASAAENDRSFSGEIVHCLKLGSGWKSDEEAAGGSFGDQAPAAESEAAAL